MKISSLDVPQADTLDLVVKLLAVLWNDESQNKEKIAKELGIVRRQVDYYEHAARILGLAVIGGGTVQFTDAGKALMEATRVQDRRRLLKEAVLNTPIIRSLLRDRRPEELSQAVVSQFLREKSTSSGATIPRRAQTIRTWIRDVSDFDPLDPSSLARKAAADANEEYAAYRGREEGPIHRGLKMAISQDPLRHLGERLTLIQVEYPFPTNDRADVLFLDEKKRFYVVEVEIDVGPHDLPGLLQAVKYKHMLAVIHGLSADAVRGVLVARNIDPAIELRANLYDIECKRVPTII